MREFRTERDLQMVNTWLAEHGLGAYNHSDIPRHGLIEPGVAVGFIHGAECGNCFLEGVITNPSAPVIRRGQAVEDIITHLVSDASALGYKRIVAICSNEGLVRIGYELGFFDLQKQILAKDI